MCTSERGKHTEAISFVYFKFIVVPPPSPLVDLRVIDAPPAHSSGSCMPDGVQTQPKAVSLAPVFAIVIEHSKLFVGVLVLWVVYCH